MTGTFYSTNIWGLLSPIISQSRPYRSLVIPELHLDSVQRIAIKNAERIPGSENLVTEVAVDVLSKSEPLRGSNTINIAMSRPSPNTQLDPIDH